MFSVDDIVLVCNLNSYEVGIVVRKYKCKGYRVYDVALERGPIFTQVRVDSKKANIYIDSSKTKSVGTKIKTWLTPEVRKTVSITLEELL